MSILVFTASPGYWGNAETFDAAVRAAEWIEVGTEILYVVCDKDDYIDECGLLVRHCKPEEKAPVFRAELRMRNGVFFAYKPAIAKPL